MRSRPNFGLFPAASEKKQKEKRKFACNLKERSGASHGWLAPAFISRKNLRRGPTNEGHQSTWQPLTGRVRLEHGTGVRNAWN